MAQARELECASIQGKGASKKIAWSKRSRVYTPGRYKDKPEDYVHPEEQTLNLPPNLIPYSRAMMLLSDSARKKSFRKMFWSPSQRILWTLQDAEQCLFLVKVEDAFTLDILPTYPCDIEHTETDIIKLHKGNEALRIGELYEEFNRATGSVVSAYCCNQERGMAFAKEIREMTEGRITMKSLTFSYQLSCDNLEIRDKGIKLSRDREWQAIIKYRKIMHFRPTQKPMPPSVLTPRSPEIP